MAWKTTLVNPVFACIDNALSPLAVIGIPLDHTGTYRPGTRFAPQKIREAACNLEIYSLMANLDLEEIGFRDYGDILLQPGEPRKAVERIELVTRNLFEEHREFTIILGGEHLLTYPVTRALGSKIDTLIVFDAHLDTRNEYIESQLNHATFLRRLTEEKDIAELRRQRVMLESKLRSTIETYARLLDMQKEDEKDEDPVSKVKVLNR